MVVVDGGEEHIEVVLDSGVDWNWGAAGGAGVAVVVEGAVEEFDFQRGECRLAVVHCGAGVHVAVVVIIGRLFALAWTWP